MKKITWNPDGNGSRYVSGPSGTVWNSWGTDLKLWECHMPQVPSTEIQNPQLDSLFYAQHKSTGSEGRGWSISVAVPSGTVQHLIGTCSECFLPQVPSTKNQNLQLENLFFPQHKSTGISHGDQSRSVRVPAETVWNSVRTDLEHLEYPLHETPFNEKKNPQLDSLFFAERKGTGSPDGDWSRSVVVPSGTVEHLIVMHSKCWDCLLPLVPSIKNRNLQLDSLFSTPTEKHWECRQELE